MVQIHVCRQPDSKSLCCFITKYFATNFSSSRSSSVFNYNWTTAQRPHWGQKKVAIVERWPWKTSDDDGGNEYWNDINTDDWLNICVISSQPIKSRRFPALRLLNFLLCSDCFVVLIAVFCDWRNSKEQCLSLWLTTNGTILTSFYRPLALLLKSLHLKNRMTNT